jgi:phosphoglycolate phosphatase-like HAD superfamily hydrolase
VRGIRDLSAKPHTARPTTINRLVLFDVDGTLLITNGLGRRVVGEVLAAQLGRLVDSYGASFSGKTDPQIFRELLTREGVTDVEPAMALALAAYEARMAEELVTASITALAGALDFVEQLAGRGDVLLGLLTGNLQPLAHAKVDRAGFRAGRFAPGLGAYGSDHEDRDRLGAIALERARAAAGRDFRPEEVLVVGDTPRDIAAARAIGATAVAVASGNFAPEELGAADLVLESLEGAGALVALLDSHPV